jgi:hypothetical protein
MRFVVEAFHSKHRIDKVYTLLRTSGRNIASLSPACLRNRQADPPRIHMGYSKEWRFLLEVIGSFALPSVQMNFPQNVSWRLHPQISRGFSENERNPKYERQPIGLIKRWKTGLGNLLISICPKRRIRERDIRDHRKRRGPKPSLFIEHCTYKGWGLYYFGGW